MVLLRAFGGVSAPTDQNIVKTEEITAKWWKICKKMDVLRLSSLSGAYLGRGDEKWDEK